MDIRKIRGKRIARLLKEKGISVRDWATKLGKSRANCYAVLEGRQNLALDDLEPTARLLGVSTEFLLKPEDEVPIFLFIRPGESRKELKARLMAQVEEYLGAGRAGLQKER